MRRTRANPGDDASGSGRGRLVARLTKNRLARPLCGDGLRARAIRGAGWTLTGFVVQQVLRLGSNLVLTRILYPEAFGLMALASVFMTGIEMFSDLGIRPAIVQNARGDDPEFLNTAWTIQIIRGFLLWTIACLMAFPISRLYGEPDLFPLLIAIGSTAAIRGFQTTGYATNSRNLLLGWMTTVELISQACGILIMIAWAAIDPSVWALAGGGIFSSIISVLVAHRVLGNFRHRLTWNRSCARDLLRFGKWVLVSSVITFVAESGDRLLIPRLVGIADLAFYSIAMMLAQLPARTFGQLANRVLFPAYSKIHQRDDHDRITKICRQFVRVSSIAYVLPLTMLFAGPKLIGIMYDERYISSGNALSLLAISAYFRMMRASQEGILLAVGNSRAHMLVNFARLLVWLPLSIPLSAAWGIEGFCAAIAVSDAVALLVQRYFTSRAILGLLVPEDIALHIVMLSAIVIAVGNTWY